QMLRRRSEPAGSTVRRRFPSAAGGQMLRRRSEPVDSSGGGQLAASAAQTAQYGQISSVSGAAL
ncbi:MAG: hypothetical protein LBI84_06450, partial [Propionibacteriaceae bacterium]|nr:hypothetical protein [Propionibacteriaceae bacterium]